MEWDYVAPRHLVCQCFVEVCEWVNNLLPKGRIFFFGYRSGIVWVSFFLVTSQYKLSANTYQYSNPGIKQKEIGRCQYVNINILHEIIVFCIRGVVFSSCSKAATRLQRKEFGFVHSAFVLDTSSSITQLHSHNRSQCRQCMSVLKRKVRTPSHSMAVLAEDSESIQG